MVNIIISYCNIYGLMFLFPRPTMRFIFFLIGVGMCCLPVTMLFT